MCGGGLSSSSELRLPAACQAPPHPTTSWPGVKLQGEVVVWIPERYALIMLQGAMQTRHRAECLEAHPATGTVNQVKTIEPRKVRSVITNFSTPGLLELNEDEVDHPGAIDVIRKHYICT